jgi:hypothetical protein
VIERPRRPSLVGGAPAGYGWHLHTRRLSLLVVTLLAGCSRSFVRPDMAQHGFRELRSTHFVVTTDLPAERAEAHVDELEALWSVLTASYAALISSAPAVREPVRVIHLADCDDFDQVIWSPGIGGFVMPSLDFEEQRTVVTCEQRFVGHEIVAHELAHDFNDAYLGVTPTWLNEGLATYFQTVEVAAGRATIGRKSALDNLSFLRDREYPGTRALVGMDSERFHAQEGRDHYIASWKLVHLLLDTSPELEARFRDYLSRLVAGVTSSEAWTQAMHGIEPQLERDYEGYLRRPELRAYTLPAPVQTRAAATSRLLGAGEAHALWAELQTMRLLHDKAGERDASIVDRQLDLAERAEPSSPQLAFWRAATAYYLHDDQGAVALLRGYLAAHPDDVRAWLGLVEVELDVAIPDATTGLEATVPPGLDAFESDVRELLRRATQARELITVAEYYLYRHQPEVGLNFAVRALALDSSCYRCLDVGAALLFRAGHIPEALAQAERALNALSEGAASPRLRARLDAYRAAARR